MSSIKSINAEIISDSRNVPTLSVSLTLESGATGKCMVPSGASTGKYEAYEMRDDGTSHGGVTKAQEIVNTVISDALVGKVFENQRELDNALLELDGTPNKGKLGGNSILGVSVAYGKAVAASEDKQFFEYLEVIEKVTEGAGNPFLYFNLINGGKHADTELSFQEYHLVPQTSSVAESLVIAQRVQDMLGEIVKEKYGEVRRGDEGGYALPTGNIREPLELLLETVKKSGLEGDVMLALDVAASSFYDEATDTYLIGGESHTKEELHDTYLSLSESFPLLSIEDPFHEEDFESFARLKEALPGVVIVGDDLTVTNITRLKKAVEMKSVSGVIIKPNQIGTLSETIDTIKYAQDNNIKCIVSHRSGETLDDMIADIVKAFHAFGMKSGARGPKEREAKYVRLSAIQNN